MDTHTHKHKHTHTHKHKHTHTQAYTHRHTHTYACRVKGASLIRALGSLDPRNSSLINRPKYHLICHVGESREEGESRRERKRETQREREGERKSRRKTERERDREREEGKGEGGRRESTEEGESVVDAGKARFLTLGTLRCRCVEVCVPPQQVLYTVP